MRINNKHTYDDDDGGGARRGLTDAYDYTGIICAVLRIRCTKKNYMEMTYKNALIP